MTFTLPCSCPECAGPLVLVNARTAGTYSVTILECLPCHWQFELGMTLRPHARTEAWEEHIRSDKRAAKRRIREREMADVS